MPQKRERHRAREPSRDDEIHIIIVHDIPRHCRWQELKDMTRSLGGEQSLKAEVFPVGNGSQMGHCTIKGRSDAMKVFENLSRNGWNGYRVRVQLSSLQKNGQLKTVKEPVVSPGMVDSVRPPTRPHQVSPVIPVVPITGPVTSHNLYATSTHPPACLAYPPQYAAMNVWPTQSGVASPTAVCAPIMSYTSSAQPYLPSTAHAQSTAPSAHYRPQQHGKNGPPPPSTSSLPVRQINDGTTILLSGLHSNQSENELRNLLRRFGEVVYLEIHPDSRNPSKTKGSARARYHTSSDAIAAVRDLDGKYLRDRKINVKQERDEQPLMTTHSRSSLRETRNGNGPSTKSQKKIAILSSNSSSAKSHRPQDCSKGSGRGTERSGGTAKSTAGPLVVNGARKSESRHVRYSHHSDDSSEDDDSNEASSATSDDEKENVARQDRSMTHRPHRL